MQYLELTNNMWEEIRGPPFNIQGSLEFLLRQIIYFNPARQRDENFKFNYMII